MANLSVRDESIGIARWFIIAVVCRIGWQVGGWLWIRLT